MPPEISQDQIDRFKSKGFSISFPYNHDPDLWERLAPYAEVIEDIYAGMHPKIYPSSREWHSSETPEQHIDRLADLLNDCRSAGVALNVVLNAYPPLTRNHQPLIDALKRLMDIGDLRITISDILWADHLRKIFPDLSMEVSTIAGIQDQYEALLWQNLVAPDMIVLGREINKRPKTIRQIRELGMRIKMVPTDTCVPNCPAFQHHVMTHSSAFGENPVDPGIYHRDFCRSMRASLPIWYWAKKEVVPAELPYLSGLVDVIKTCDRLKTTEENLQTLADYIRMESDENKDLGYRQDPALFESVASCERVCNRCAKCEDAVEVLRITDAINDYCPATGQTEDAKQDADPQEDTSHEAQPRSTGVASAQELKRRLSESDDAAALGLLAFVLQRFQAHIRGTAALSNGYRFERLFHPFDGAVGLEWHHGDAVMKIAIIRPDKRTDVACRTRHAGLLVLSEDSDDSRPFNQVENELTALIR